LVKWIKVMASEGTKTVQLKQYWALLGRYLTPQWPRALLLAVLLTAHIGLQLVSPQIMRLFIDSATAGGPSDVLFRAALVFLGVALATQVLSVANTYLGENVAWTATNALRYDLTAHCLKLDQSFHKAHTPGELIERIDGDVNLLSNFFSRMVIYVLANAVLLVGILAMLYREDWRVGLCLSCFAALALVILIRIRTIAIPYWAESRQQMAEFYGFLGERLGGTEDIRANGAQGHVMRGFYELTRQRYPVAIKAGMTSYGMWMTNVTVFGTGIAVAYALSAYLWRTEAITIGTVYLIVYYTQLLSRPIAQIRAQITDLQQADASIGRIRALLGTPSKLCEGTGGPLPSGALPVAFQDVSFSYDEGDTVLHGVSFALRPKRVLGLLGRTGSGKTTIARLLLRLYDPCSGEIRLGGVATQTTRLREIRDRVGMVTQDVQLFQATVRDNLTFYNPSISDGQILAALQDLGLSEWLGSLPEGLDTQLEAGSGGLSAGQAQLLAFARVFLADPGLVILDEASSRLDPATERLIERAVDRLLRDRTGIVIAHRLATVHRADEVLILEDGQILEHGERTALASDPGSRFHHLLQTGLQEVLA
jgi:ABC-type multidrug transport system fused ATPase/permease subunit